MDIFKKRVAFKPFEYPETTAYKEAINHSYWLVSEWNFIGDVQEFATKLTPLEQSVVRKAALAISQIEVSVKRFWGALGERFPKAEFENVGTTFAESEVRHADAYSHLLQVLGLNDDFSTLVEEPVMKGRVDYLTKYLKGASGFDDEDYMFSLSLFSIFIENVSLFSQFLILKSFNKHMNVLKDIDNVIQATQKEETIHALFGVYLITEIKKEHPEWFNEAYYSKLSRACNKAYKAEAEIIDWIFSEGDLPFLTKDMVKEFTKNRFNESLQMLGAEPNFKVDQQSIAPLKWFDEENLSDVNIDFFYKRSVMYSKKSKPVTAEELF